MTQDEIIEMARQASFTKPFHEFFPQLDVYVLEAFAKLVAAKEREATIKIIKETPFSNWFQADLVEAIRARGKA